MVVRHSKPFRDVDEHVIMQAILQGTATETGVRFFSALVESLSSTLNAYSSWVTEYIEATHQLRSLAFWVNGTLMKNFAVDITGTPCEAVIKNIELVHYPDGIMNIFPDNALIRDFSAVSYMGVPLLDSDGNVLGNLAVLDNQPMPEEPKAEMLFRIFAARAAAELQRLYAEKEIRYREEKYRRIVETAGEGFLLMDEKLNITDVNRAFCQLINLPQEEIIGKTPLEFAPEDFRQFLMTNRKEIFHGRYKDFEGSVVAAGGVEIPVLIHGNTLRDDKGEVIGNMAFITDMSQQKKSLRLAGEIQKSLQPQNRLQIHGLDIAGKTIACDEIGGDYFDFLQDPGGFGDRFDVVVGDVTGHGVDAALLMASARAFLRMCVAKYDGISEIVTEINHHLAMDFLITGRFMTLFYLSIDPKFQNLRWVRAGHDPAVVYDPFLDNFVELQGSGLALGVDGDFVFEEFRKTDLQQGQIIAIGTDGIWESCNRNGVMFGKNRFKEIIRENARLAANEIIDAVYCALKNFTHGLKQADDITLVVIKIQDLPQNYCDWQI